MNMPSVNAVPSRRDFAPQRIQSVNVVIQRRHANLEVIGHLRQRDLINAAVLVGQLGSSLNHCITIDADAGCADVGV